MTEIQLWRRLGLVFNGSGKAAWMASHAAYPTPLPLSENVVRIYFSPRDGDNRGCIAALDLALEGERFSIVKEPEFPLLRAGARGAFDDSGVTVGCVVPDGDDVLVYYLGWSLSITVPFRNFIGLARGPRAGTAFERVSVAPVLDRSAIDPYTLGYPWVLRDAGGWRMWYSSHLCWGEQDADMRHVIKEARSADGICWQRDGRIVIAVHEDGPEWAVTRPCVLRDRDRYVMWYARRTPPYRLGYAESADGETWVRADHVPALTGPAADWESEMTTYAAVFDLGRDRYMVYNGNGFGRTGFGLAILTQ